MAKYNVLCNIPGLKAEAGDIIELSDKEAAGLVRPGVLELIPSKAAKSATKEGDGADDDAGGKGKGAK